MKDYGLWIFCTWKRREKVASASMVFVGNINQSVDVLLKTSSLFDPFPPEMVQILLSLIECIVIFLDGRFPSLDQSISQVIMDS